MGILAGFAANLIVLTFNAGAKTWRLQIASSFIPAVPLACLVFFCEFDSKRLSVADRRGTESPRWYMRHERMRDAYVAMRKLRKSDVQATRDLYYAWVQWQTEKAAIGDRSVIKRFGDLFTVPRIRRATLAAASVHIGQDFCGINSVSTCFLERLAGDEADPKPSLFTARTFSRSVVRPMSRLSGPRSVSERSTLFSHGQSQRRGKARRSFQACRLHHRHLWPSSAQPVLLPANGLESLCRRSVASVANCTLADTQVWVTSPAPPKFEWVSWQRESTGRSPVCADISFVYVYIIFYSIGEGPIPFMYSAELFPLAHRELGQAFGVSLNYFVNFILSLIVCFWLALVSGSSSDSQLPFQLYRLGGAGTFGEL